MADAQGKAIENMQVSNEIQRQQSLAALLQAAALLQSNAPTS